MISDEDIIVQLSAKLIKSGIYTSKTDAIEDIAKKLGVKISKIADKDLKRAQKILSRGEPLSKIVISSRGT